MENEAVVKDGQNEDGLVTNETKNPTTPKKDVFAKGDDKTSIDGKQVKPGDELKYKIKYRNGTGKEQKVTITDKIPKYTKYVKGSADNDVLAPYGRKSFSMSPSAIQDDSLRCSTGLPGIGDSRCMPAPALRSTKPSSADPSWLQVIACR